MFDIDQVVNEYNEKGVVRLRGFFSADEVQEIRGEIDRYIREDLATRPPDACTRELDGKTIRNLWRLERYCAYFNELANRPGLRDLIARLVNGDPVLIAIETFNKPARVGSGVPYHQDNAYFCLAPPDALTVWIALDRVTVENGAVYFIEGSHKLGTLPTKKSGVAGNSIGLAIEPDQSNDEQLGGILEPGDITIHHCQTIHHSDPNTTDRARLGLLFVFRGAHTSKVPHLAASYEEALAAIRSVDAS